MQESKQDFPKVVSLVKWVKIDKVHQVTLTVLVVVNINWYGSNLIGFEITVQFWIRNSCTIPNEKVTASKW